MSYKIFTCCTVALLLGMMLGTLPRPMHITASQDLTPTQYAGLHDRFEKAKKLFDENDLDSAYKEFHRLRVEFEGIKDWESYLRSSLFIADIHRAKRDQDSAFYYLNNAMTNARERFSDKNLIFAEINHKYGVALIDKGSFDEARVFIERAISLRTQPGLPPDSSLSLSYNSLGNIF
ncbi:MAG: hypothetical protein U1C46_00510, partial [Bacteroidales bacterium]|nr:hypothetical protein [Bacteroidales bacterium]